VAGIYSSVLTETSVTDLPSWVYDDLANPDISQIDVPWGRYNLPTQNDITRGNLTIDWHGSTLVLDGALAGVHFYFRSTVINSAEANHYFHLTDQIYEATTQLTMPTIIDLSPGEIVQIRCGVNTSDPNEPVRYLVKTVDSVSGSTVTFTEPFGLDIPVYADETALKAVVIESQWNKIGPWGEMTANGSYGNGLGLDHGMIRYTGGMQHDIIFKNAHFETLMPADIDIPPAEGTVIFVQDILNFSLLNTTACNLIKVLFHSFRSDNMLVDGHRFTGVGRTNIIAPHNTFIGTLVAAWGGTGLTYQNIEVKGQNMVMANMEIFPVDLLFKNITFTTDFRRNWSYNAAAVMFGFYNCAERIEDSTFTITTDSISSWNLDANNSLLFKNCVFDDPSTFSNYFYFPRHTIEGTITFGGITYGPLTSRSDTVTRTGTVTGKHIIPPRGLYKSLTYRIPTTGNSWALGVGYGGTIFAAAYDAVNYTSVSNNWLQIAPNTSDATRYAANVFTCYFTGGTASMVMDFQLEYYPAPDDVGWTTD
jgi:hypothetical protein